MYGCGNNDALSDMDKAPEVIDKSFLDIDPPMNGEFSKEQFEILGLANERLNEYLVIEEDTCYLTVHRAKELNMSERLFALMEQSVRNANLQYQMYLIFKDNNKGIIIRNPFDLHLNLPLTKAYTESTLGYNSSITYITLSHKDVTLLINEMRAANGVITTFAAGITGKFSDNIASGLVTAYGYLVDSKFSKIQDDYARSGSTAGLTLIESTVWSPTTGITSTTYSARIN